MLYSMQSFAQTLFQNDENDLLNCTIYNNIIKYLPILAHYFYNYVKIAKNSDVAIY